MYHGVQSYNWALKTKAQWSTETIFQACIFSGLSQRDCYETCIIDEFRLLNNQLMLFKGEQKDSTEQNLNCWSYL